MAAPAMDRTPRVTTTASQTRPANVSKVDGWADTDVHGQERTPDRGDERADAPRR